MVECRYQLKSSYVKFVNYGSYSLISLLSAIIHLSLGTISEITIIEFTISRELYKGSPDLGLESYILNLYFNVFSLYTLVKL